MDAQDQPVRVLLADDNALVGRQLRHSLGIDEGIEVVGIVTSGQEAVEAVDTCRPDVILMDLRMPEMNGLEATRAVKSQHEGVAVVIHSVYDDFPHRVEARKAGADAYLAKDESIDALVECIRKAAAEA